MQDFRLTTTWDKIADEKTSDVQPTIVWYGRPRLWKEPQGTRGSCR